MLESQFLASKKGQVAGMQALFIGLVTIGIISLVGLLIFSNVSSNIDQSGFTTAQNTTAGKIKDTVLDSYELAIVGLIVFAAVVILGAVYLLGR